MRGQCVQPPPQLGSARIRLHPPRLNRQSAQSTDLIPPELLCPLLSLARALMALAVRQWDGGPCMGSHTHHGGTCALEEGDAFEGIDTSYGDALEPDDIGKQFQIGCAFGSGPLIPSLLGAVVTQSRLEV